MQSLSSSRNSPQPTSSFAMQIQAHLIVQQDGQKLVDQQDELYLRFHARQGATFYQLEITSQNHIRLVFTAELDELTLKDTLKQTALDLPRYVAELRHALDLCKIHKDHQITFEVHNRLKAFLSVYKKVPLKRLQIFRVQFELAKLELLNENIQARYSLMLEGKDRCLERLEALKKVLQLRNPQLLQQFCAQIRKGKQRIKQQKY